MKGLLARIRGKKDGKEALRHVLGDYEPPSFPTAILEILRVIRNLDATMDEVAASLVTHPGLVVKILKTVNSASFGLARQVNDVTHAANMLGRSRVEALVLTIATKEVLPSEEAPGFDAQRFWTAAARRATLARPLAKLLHPTTQMESFTAALLQDIALPVLATARPHDYGPVMERWHADPQAELHLLEEETFGWTHMEIADLISEEWGLPDKLRSAIVGHHGPCLDKESEPAVRLVSHIRESNEETGVARIIEQASQEHGLDPKTVERIIEEAWDHAAELVQLLR